MATPTDRREYELKTARLVQPAKPFPKIPDVLKQKPAYKAAWEQWEKQVQEWVDNGRGG